MLSEFHSSRLSPLSKDHAITSAMHQIKGKLQKHNNPQILDIFNQQEVKSNLKL